MFRVVTSDGDIIPPFIFPQGLRLNTEAYIKWVKELELTWTEMVVAGRLYVCQQDSASFPLEQENPVLAVRKYLRLRHP